MSFARVILIFVTVLLHSRSIAQGDELYWRMLDMRHGLPFPESKCMLEDEKGFIWIGTTKGLSRFDGTRFTNFLKDSLTIGKLYNDEITRLATDQEGNIIIGTQDGFSIFDYKTGLFQNFRVAIQGYDEDKLNWIIGIGAWQDNHIWLATLDGTIDWDRNSNSFTRLDDLFTVSMNTLSDPIVCDADGKGCWIALKGRVAHYNYVTKELEMLHQNTGFYSPDPATAIVEGMTVDQDGRVWYSSLGDSALFRYDPKSHTERQFKLYHITPEYKMATSVVGLFCDRQQHIWISSWNEGLRVLNTEDGESYVLNFQNRDQFHLPIATVWDILQTSTGEIWVANGSGVGVHSPAMEAAISYPKPTSSYSSDLNMHIISAIAEDVDHHGFLVGTDGAGLFFYDRDGSIMEQHRTVGEPNETNAVSALKWINGEVWCGTRRGVQIFNTQSKTFRAFDGINDREFRESSIAEIAVHENEVWFSCRNSKIYCYHLSDATVEIFGPDVNNPLALQSVFAPNMEFDEKGVLWLGHRNGVTWLDREKNEFHHIDVFSEKSETMIRNRAVGMVSDRRGHIWFSTRGAGLFRIDIETKTFESMNQSEFIGSNYPFALTLDGDGRLWFGSRSGLIWYDFEKDKFNHFNLEQNVSSSVAHGGGILLHDGLLLVAGDFDLVIVDPEKGIRQTAISPPLISSAEGGDINWNNLDGYIFLDRHQNNFTFHFSSLSDAARDDIEYRYQLVGIDDDWILADNRTTATYNDIEGGNYTFRVSSRIPGGDWIETKEPLIVKVQRQIIQTSGFRLVVLAVLVLLVFFIVYFRKKSTKVKARQRALQYFVNSQHTQSVEEICWDIARNCIDKLGFEDCVVYIKDPHRAVLKQTAAFSASRKEMKDLVAPLEVPFGVGIVGSVAASAKPERIADTSLDKRYIVDDDRRYSELAVPIVHEGHVIGVLDSEHARKNYFSEEDERSLVAIAAVCAGKIVHANAAKEVEEKEQMLAEINRLLSESQLVSLRAQMNPHFVFNCLNSIQESIVMKQYAEASLYLNKFSKLFRQVLQNSTKNLITLKEELDVLRLYLELEHMRFQKSFDYSIECSDELDTDEIMVPSMLLQPFVENALWHGLMHKADNRKLSIRFYAMNEEVFVCVIEDNGIGRKKSAEIKKEKALSGTHQSKGISISMDRLNLIHLKQSKHATVEIVDLTDANENASGTKVIFELSAYLN